ncbi:MAG: hypothetical protein KGN76_08870, partial [Acidobacteriota bacterium]|nr:hypothetical protein [Acidobacteriota bacterium]
MSRRLTLIAVCLAATVAFFIGVLSADHSAPGLADSSGRMAPQALARAISASPAPSPAGAGTVLVNWADIAARLNPTVVSIDATSEPSA